MRFLLLLMITILFISCRKQVDVSIDFYKEYYPVNVGSWIEYEVTDIIIIHLEVILPTII